MFISVSHSFFVHTTQFLLLLLLLLLFTWMFIKVRYELWFFFATAFSFFKQLLLSCMFIHFFTATALAAAAASVDVVILFSSWNHEKKCLKRFGVNSWNALDFDAARPKLFVSINILYVNLKWGIRRSVTKRNGYYRQWVNFENCVWNAHKYCFMLRFFPSCSHSLSILSLRFASFDVFSIFCVSILRFLVSHRFVWMQ